MTEVKWVKIAQEECQKVNEADGHILLDPRDWPHYRKALVKFMAAVDEVTEVYNMENKGVSNGK